MTTILHERSRGDQRRIAEGSRVSSWPPPEKAGQALAPSEPIEAVPCRAITRLLPTCWITSTVMLYGSSLVMAAIPRPSQPRSSSV